MCSRQIIYKYFHTIIRKQASPALTSVPNIMLQVTRESSYRSSKPLGSPDLYTDVEISKSPEEWKFVERLLPLETIPKPTPKSDYPSGWRPSIARLWNALQDELKSYLGKRSGGKNIYMQVHEVCRQINVKGDYVNIVQEWLQDKGF
ncbi:putative 39S ribosomal protein L49 [Blattella germanica]|nr:putative 39S ribosomal protein L49 [Blattella germanica]